MHGDSDLSLMNYEFIYKVSIIHGNISVKIINFCYEIIKFDYSYFLFELGCKEKEKRGSGLSSIRQFYESNKTVLNGTHDPGSSIIRYV